MYDPDPSLPKPFTPSSHDLDDMIARAMARADAGVEQARLRSEKQQEDRIERNMLAEAEQRRRAFWK